MKKSTLKKVLLNIVPNSFLSLRNCALNTDYELLKNNIIWNLNKLIVTKLFHSNTKGKKSNLDSQV